MITIYLRIFPSGKNGRRGSFISREIKIDKLNPIVKDIFSYNKEISEDGYKIARGVSFLNLHDKIEDEENLNAIPIRV